jgi:hypothetical protein
LNVDCFIDAVVAKETVIDMALQKRSSLDFGLQSASDSLVGNLKEN